MGFTGFLLGFTGFYWVSQGFIRFYWVLLGFTGFYWVLPSFSFPATKMSFCHRISPTRSGFDRVLPSFTEFYRVLRFLPVGGRPIDASCLPKLVVESKKRNKDEDDKFVFFFSWVGFSFSFFLLHFTEFFFYESRRPLLLRSTSFCFVCPRRRRRRRRRRRWFSSSSSSSSLFGVARLFELCHSLARVFSSRKQKENSVKKN